MSKFAALALDTEKPGRMLVVHPVSRQPLRDGEGKEAYIDLYSGDSEQARRHYRAVTRRRLALKRAKVSPEEIEAEAVELLCALTAGWYLLDLEGKPLEVEFTADNARELYGLAAVAWLRDQVDEYIADRGNFSKASSTN
jgi:hypothetical protein